MALGWLLFSTLLGGCSSDRETTLRRSSRARAVGELRAEREKQERELKVWEAARKEALRDVSVARLESVQASSDLRTIQAERVREQQKLGDAEKKLLAAVERAVQTAKELQPLRALEQQLRDQDALIKAANARVKALAAEVAKALEGAAKQEAILKPKLEAAQARLVALQAAGVTIKDVEAKIAAAQEALAPPPTPKKKD